MVPVLVTGCGFCGTNAIVKYLMDQGYYAGQYFLKPNLKMHPYPIYEDAEFHHAQEMLDREWRWFLKDLINLRNKYFSKWCFKAPNSFLYLDSYMKFPFKIIAGIRDKPTLISRMMERWSYTKDMAEKRIKLYLGETRKYPCLVVHQQSLLKHPEKEHGRIKCYIATKE